MTELEKVLEEAKKTGKLALRFEGVKGGAVKISMDIQGFKEDGTWGIRVKLGDGSAWKRTAVDEELEALVHDFYGLFSKMGRERGRA